MENLQLTIVLGQYAQIWHLPDRAKTLTETVKQWERYWPDAVPLPHPSPRNNRWLKQNPWFEQDLLPVLRNHVRTLLS